MSVFIVSTALFVIGFAAQRSADVRDEACSSTTFYLMFLFIRLLSVYLA
jgi:hypothetical protein